MTHQEEDKIHIDDYTKVLDTTALDPAVIEKAALLRRVAPGKSVNYSSLTSLPDSEIIRHEPINSSGLFVSDTTATAGKVKTSQGSAFHVILALQWPQMHTYQDAAISFCLLLRIYHQALTLF